jgi:hypothetical protein
VALILLFHPIPQMDRVPHVTPPVCYKETKQTLNKKNWKTPKCGSDETLKADGNDS